MAKKNVEVKLVYIGDEFYSKSKTMMSSIYEEGTWERYDWGFVGRELQKGNTVNIRPCTDAEYGQACRMLAKAVR